MRLTDIQRHLATTPDVDRLHTLQLIEKHHAPLATLTEARMRRQAWLAKLHGCQRYMVQVWQDGDWHLVDHSDACFCSYADARKYAKSFTASPTSVVRRIALCSWSRDCDSVEGTHRTLVHPSRADARVESDLKWAEGPMTHWLQSPDAHFEATYRDRTLEAFENGHLWSI